MSLFLQLYFFLLPFQFALAPVSGVDLAIVRPITIALCLFWLAHGLLRRRVVMPPLLPFFLFSGFLLLTTLSFFWSEQGGFALRKNLFLLSLYPLLFVCLSWLREHPGGASVMLKAFVGGAFFAAWSGLLFFAAQFVFGVAAVFAFLTQNILPFFLGGTFAQAVTEHPSLLVNLSGATVLRASGVFPDPHMFSFYLGMAIPLALALFLVAPSGKAFRGFVLGSLVLADLLSFSRGAYVGLLVGTVFFLVFSGIFSRLTKRQRWGVLVAGLLFPVIFFFSPVGTRFFSSFSSEDGSNMERLRLWGEAAGHIAERPLFGVGLGNYAATVVPGAAYRAPIYAHNLFLDIAVEVGLVGLALFVALLVLALFGAAGAWRKRQDVLALSLMVALVVFTTHAFFETPLFSVHVLPVFLLLLSVGVSYRYDKTVS